MPCSGLLEEPCKLRALSERRKTCLPCLGTIFFFTFLFLFLLLRGLGGIVCLGACVVVSRQLARVFKVHPHCGRVRISAAKASIHIHVFNTYNWHIRMYVYQTFVCSSTHWNKCGFFLWGGWKQYRYEQRCARIWLSPCFHFRRVHSQWIAGSYGTKEFLKFRLLQKLGVEPTKEEEQPMGDEPWVTGDSRPEWNTLSTLHPANSSGSLLPCLVCLFV